MTHLLSRAQAGPVRLLRLGARSKKTRSAYYVPLPSSSSSSKGGGGKPAVIQRDAMGRPIVKQREKSLGTFKALPAGGLQHELFESEDDGPGRVGLDVPVMLPRMLVPGVATRFHDMDASSPMRVYGVPKHMLLEFRILGAPISITTSTTLSLIRALEESAQNSKSQSLVLNGRSGTGKSFLLLQAAQYASSSRTWIVLYIPRAQRLVDSSTPFVYSLATRTYLQPRASAQILSRLQRANAHILPQLSTRTAITLPDNAGNFPAGTPLPTLIEAGVTAEAIAPHLLEAVMRELGEQEEYPVLIAIDDFQALAGRTLYRDPRFKMVRPHHLSVPRLLLEYAGGKKKLKRGLVLSALSRSDTQFPVPPQLADALRLPHDFAPTPRGVGLRRSAQLAEYLEGEVEEPIPSSSSVDDPLADPSPSAGAEQWTGYRAYSPPLYEDALFASATAAQPFPSARPEEEVWKGKVLRDEIDEPVVNEVVEEGLEEGAEGAEAVAAEGEVEAGKTKKLSKKQKAKAAAQATEGQKAKTRKVRALRAVRVPDALTVREAAGLFEVWMDSGMLRTGGQRRALRRAELDTLDEYRAVKAEVDADPETAFDEVLADVRPKRPSSSSPLKQSPASAPAAKPKDAFAAFAEVTSVSAAASKTETALGDAAAALALADRGEAAEVEDERTIAALRAELAGPAYDEVRAMEQAAGRVAWARGLEKGTGSLEAEREVATSRADGTLEDGAQAGVEVEALGQEQVKGGEDVSVGGDEFLRAVEALDPSSASSPASVSDAPTPTRPQTRTPLDLGDDPEIARLVSAGVRAALTHPDSVGELLRAPVGVDASGGRGGAGGWTETGVFANRSSPSSPSYDGEADSHSDEEGGAVGEEAVESDDEDGRDGLGYELEEETGADELFLGKYAESSGNARAFVGGLVGTLQTSG